MESLSDLVYCSLKEEEEQTTGWSKTTIDYVANNRSKVFASIRGIAKSRGKILQTADVEEIYSALIEYLYKSDDYNIEKAYTDNNLVSFEGYLHSCTKYCVIRYVTNMYKEEKVKVPERIDDEDGKEMSIFDTIAGKPNEEYTDIGFDLESICKLFESERYTYGTDIFMLWFIRLNTIVYNKHDRYKDILSVLGISKKEINLIEQQSTTEGAMLSIAKAVSLIGVEEAIKVIRRYTYSYKRIEDVIRIF